MGIQLVEEVLDYAPAKLTPQQRYILVVLAQNANDRTRECWPGYDDTDNKWSEQFRRRVQCSRTSFYTALKALIASGALDVVEHGHNGRRAKYRIPELDPSVQSAAASSVPETGTLRPGQSETKGPVNRDATDRVASRILPSSVPKTGTPSPQISSSKETPQREGARARHTPARPSSGSRPRTSLPSDFAVTDEMRTWCTENVAHADVDAETEKFTDWCRSKGTTSANWEAEWRNWMRKAKPLGYTAAGSRWSTTDERVQQGLELVEFFGRVEAGEMGVSPPRVRSTTDERVQQGLELVKRFRQKRLAAEAGKGSEVIEGEIVG